ncbi:MAG: tRNA (5-methylaminomethyl-2-thiouridine)(34)-methyltransferase MnmD [Balneolaceae bacterium]
MTTHTDLHLCNDGSHTLYSEQFQQFYHNPNGAIAESRHNFFDVPGWLDQAEPGKPVHLFEVGFGTGLNLLLLLEYLHTRDPGLSITYYSVEAYPIPVQQAAKLNYPRLLDLPNAAELLACIFRDTSPGPHHKVLSNGVTLHLFVGPFSKVPKPDFPIDVFLFDPFSPDVNPDLWSPNVFETLASWSTPDAILSTYGAATSSRAAMAMGGWSLARTRGALGKREMTLASPDPARLSSWKRLNEDRLRERYQAGDFN